MIVVNIVSLTLTTYFLSIPDGVFGIFHWHNPSGRTMALRSTQHHTQMSIRSISWGFKAAGA